MTANDSKANPISNVNKPFQPPISSRCGEIRRAKGEASAKLMEVTTSTRTQKSTTGRASSLSSESDMSLTAKETVKVVGSQVNAAGDLAVDAKYADTWYDAK